MKFPASKKMLGAIRLLEGCCLIISALTLAVPLSAWAISSPNYQIQEDFLGGNGGVVDSSSANYRSRDSIGALGVGDAASTNYRTQSGATTTNDPALTFSMDTSSINFGTLSAATSATGTAQFSVTNYTSFGYTVQAHYASSNINNDTTYPLTNQQKTYTFSSPSAGAVTATAGTELFGFNLVANTSPTTFGADPQQIPDNTFSFGAASGAYNVPNKYNFPSLANSNADTLASASKSSGKTIYTMSFVANISDSTPAGSYRAQQELICLGTY